MKKFFILFAILLLSASSAWAEIGGSLRDFMESDYALAHNLSFSKTRRIGRNAPADMKEYNGQYEHSFAQQIGRMRYDYGLILVSEQKSGDVILAQKLTFETPMNWDHARVIHEFVINHIAEATDGEILLNEERLHNMMREAVLNGEYIEKVEGFIISIHSSRYHERAGGNREKTVYLTEVLIRK